MKVIEIVTSEDNPSPRKITWFSDGDEIAAIAAVATILKERNTHNAALPERHHLNVVEIRVVL